jgi:hypothetical protein
MDLEMESLALLNFPHLSLRRACPPANFVRLSVNSFGVGCSWPGETHRPMSERTNADIRTSMHHFQVVAARRHCQSKLWTALEGPLFKSARVDSGLFIPVPVGQVRARELHEFITASYRNKISLIDKHKI